MRKILIAVFALWGGFAQAQSIQVLGDDVMNWNSSLKISIVDVLEQEFGSGVTNNSIDGAVVTAEGGGGGIASFFNAPQDISTQYDSGDWDWVVVNGGLNDMLTKCECGSCGPVVDALSSENGQTGAMVDIITQARVDGVQVVLVGHYLAPITGGPMFYCANELLDLNDRFESIADQNGGVHFVNPSDFFARHQLTYYNENPLHLNVAGTLKIAEAIVATIKEN
ncbi:MAG: SGNH/GDSL hydrolase family protein [Pseudomonadota bacterium]